ncbi:diguanylate cyclase [Leptolyngbya sp. FACHB-60]|uniref:diguanylate cyclase n=1 Tax=unclassified Leptolyngbya TaxID=2650499 RepID=UPI0018EFF49D
MILPNTALDEAVAIAQKIQAQIWQTRILHSDSNVSPFITVSLGVVSLKPNAETTVLSLIKQADEALYMAKQQGRDRLQVACHSV